MSSASTPRDLLLPLLLLRKTESTLGCTRWVSLRGEPVSGLPSASMAEPTEGIAMRIQTARDGLAIEASLAGDAVAAVATGNRSQIKRAGLLLLASCFVFFAGFLSIEATKWGYHVVGRIGGAIIGWDRTPGRTQSYSSCVDSSSTRLMSRINSRQKSRVRGHT